MHPTLWLDVAYQTVLSVRNDDTDLLSCAHLCKKVNRGQWIDTQFHLRNVSFALDRTRRHIEVTIDKPKIAKSAKRLAEFIVN